MAPRSSTFSPASTTRRTSSVWPPTLYSRGPPITSEWYFRFPSPAPLSSQMCPLPPRGERQLASSRIRAQPELRRKIELVQQRRVTWIAVQRREQRIHLGTCEAA